MKKVVRSIVKFLISPYLWHKAHRDHNNAYKACKATTTGTVEWRKAYEATWEPFNRTFDYLMPAYFAYLVYVFTAVAILLVIYY